MEPRVDFGHEGVEMRAALAPDGRRLEEEVHQRRLATADLSPEIETARLTVAGKSPGQARAALRLELAQQPVERAERLALRFVAHDPALGDEGPITRGEQRRGFPKQGRQRTLSFKR